MTTTVEIDQAFRSLVTQIGKDIDMLISKRADSTEILEALEAVKQVWYGELQDIEVENSQ